MSLILKIKHIKEQRLFVTKVVTFHLMLFFVMQLCYAGFSFRGGYDEGLSWSEVYNEHVTSISTLSLLRYEDEINDKLENKIYTGTRDGVFLHDSTHDWMKLKETSDGSTNPVKALSLQLHREGIYVGTYDEGIFELEYIGQDKKGFIWKNIGLADENILTLYSDGSSLYAGTDEGKIYKGEEDEREEEWKWRCIYQLEDKQIHALYLGFGFLYAGTDGGDIFEIDTKTNSSKNVGLSTLTDKPILVLNGIGNYLYAGTYGDGVFSRKVGDKYKKADWDNIGLKGKHIFSLFFKGGNLYAGADNDIFEARISGYSDDFEKSNWRWKQVAQKPLDSRILTLVNADARKVYVGTDSGKIFRTKIKTREQRKQERRKRVKTQSTFDEVSQIFGDTIHIKQGEDEDKPESKRINILYSHGDGYLYVGSDVGLSKTKDGVAWVNEEGLENKSILAIYLDGDDLYVGTNKKEIFKKHIVDNGKNKWTRILSCSKDLPSNIQCSEPATILLCSHDGELYVAINREAIFKRSNDSDMWELLKAFKGDVITLLRSIGGYLYVGIKGEGLFVFGEDGNWKRKYLETEKGIAQAIYLDEKRSLCDENEEDCLSYDNENEELRNKYKKKSVLYIGTSAGIFKTVSGKGYYHIEPFGLDGKNVVTLHFHDHDGYLYAGTKYNGVFRRKKGEDKWLHVGLTFEHVSSLASYNNNELYAGTEGGRMYVTNGLFEKWEQTDLKNEPVQFFHEYQDALYVKASDEILKITDGNERTNIWSNVQIDKKEKLPKPHILCTRYTKDEERKIYTITEQGQIYGLDVCSHCCRLKECWKKYRSKLKLEDKDITAFTSHKGRFYVGASKGIYSPGDDEDNQKEEWKLVGDKTSQLEGLKINTFYIGGGCLYVGTSKGVYKKTSDSIRDWESLGLKGKNVYALHCRNELNEKRISTKFLYIGTEKHGVLKLNLNEKTLTTAAHYKGIKAFYSNDHSLFIGTADGRIYETKNNGKTWTNVARINAEIFEFYFYNNSLHVSTSDGIYEQKFW